LWFRPVFVDVFSVVGGLVRVVELFRGFAYVGVDAVFVLDAWSETHLPLARRFARLCREYGIECVLSEHEPAERLGLKLCEQANPNPALLTRDLEPATHTTKCTILHPRKGRVYRVYRP